MNEKNLNEDEGYNIIERNVESILYYNLSALKDFPISKDALCPLIYDKNKISIINNNFGNINTNLDNIFKDDNKEKISKFNNSLQYNNNLFLDTKKKRILYQVGEQIVFIEKNKITIIPRQCFETKEEEEKENNPMSPKHKEFFKSYKKNNNEALLKNYIAWEIGPEQSSKLVFHKELDDNGEEIIIENDNNNNNFEYNISCTGHNIFLTFPKQTYEVKDEENNNKAVESVYSLEIVKKDGGKIEPDIVISSNMILDPNDEAKKKHENILKGIKNRMSLNPKNINSNYIIKKDNSKIEHDIVINSNMSLEHNANDKEAKEENENILKEIKNRMSLNPKNINSNYIHKESLSNDKGCNCCNNCYNAIKECCNNVKTSLTNLCTTIKTALFGS